MASTYRTIRRRTMKFYFPPAGPKPTLSEKFDRHFQEVEHRKLVKRVIREEVRAYQAERLMPRLKGLEQQRREAEREHALAQAGGDADATEYHQAKINRMAGEIAEVERIIG
jgi:hypothetical protein